MDIEVFYLRQSLRQKRPLSFFRQGEFLFELFPLFDALDHFDALENIARLDSKFVQDPFIQTG